MQTPRLRPRSKAKESPSILKLILYISIFSTCRQPCAMFSFSARLYCTCQLSMHNHTSICLQGKPFLPSFTNIVIMMILNRKDSRVDVGRSAAHWPLHKLACARRIIIAARGAQCRRRDFLRCNCGQRPLLHFPEASLMNDNVSHTARSSYSSSSTDSTLLHEINVQIAREGDLHPPPRLASTISAFLACVSALSYHPSHAQREMLVCIGSFGPDHYLHHSHRHQRKLYND
uniref:Uncharacterized protein n=1 Tax=Trichogramma kaykai TaxID=54128 RepID=A0ABD2WV14_9HYME